MTAWTFVLPFVPGFGLIIFGRALEGRPASQVVALIVVAVAMFVGVLWTIARGVRASSNGRSPRSMGE